MAQKLAKNEPGNQLGNQLGNEPGNQLGNEVGNDASKPASPISQRWYLLLALGAIAGYWIPRLLRGFWLDETGSYWVAHKGFTRVWDNLQIYPGQSIIYTHICALFAWGGPLKEIPLRLPSVAAALCAAWLLFRLTERVVGPGSGFLAVVPFLCAGAIVEIATTARPYAMGMVVILASIYSLREWVHTRSWRQFTIHCATSSLIVYFHYLFGLVFLSQWIYLWVAHRGGRKIAWGLLAAAALFDALIAIPVLLQALTIARMAGTWKTDYAPTALTFLSLYPVQVAITALIGLVFLRFLHPKWFARPQWLAQEDTVLLLSWLLLAPVMVFAVARSTSYALFVSRYLIYALLPAFILLAWALHQMKNEGARLAVLVAVALNAALYVPSMRLPEWRTPLAIADVMAGADTPLLLMSGFVESTGADLRGEPKASSYLFAPLTAYPVHHEVIPVAFYLDASAQQSLLRQIEHLEASHSRFCLLAGNGSDAMDLLPKWFHDRGYRSSEKGSLGFTVTVFEKPAAVARTPIASKTPEMISIARTHP